MADPSSSNKERAFVIVVPVGLPLNCINALRNISGWLIQELQCIVCGMQCARRRISKNKIQQLVGVVSVHAAVCIAIGRLCGVTFCKSKSNNWSKVLITSVTNDAWAIPTSQRECSSRRFALRNKDTDVFSMAPIPASSSAIQVISFRS